jgi:hypothetical protein
VIAKADIRRVQEWMGHADIQTTMKYLHYAPHPEDARLVNEAFALSDQGTLRDASGTEGDAFGTQGDASAGRKQPGTSQRSQGELRTT